MATVVAPLLWIVLKLVVDRGEFARCVRETVKRRNSDKGGKMRKRGMVNTEGRTGDEVGRCTFSSVARNSAQVRRAWNHRVGAGSLPPSAKCISALHTQRCRAFTDVLSPYRREMFDKFRCIIPVRPFCSPLNLTPVAILFLRVPTMLHFYFTLFISFYLRLLLGIFLSFASHVNSRLLTLTI